MVSDWYRIETKKAGIAHHYRQVQGERTHPDIGLLTTGFNRSVADLFRLARFWLCR
jgi:hypothetical protein